MQVWSPATGFFAYSSENMIVVEDLLTRKQRYLAAHSKVGCPYHTAHRLLPRAQTET